MIGPRICTCIACFLFPTVFELITLCGMHCRVTTIIAVDFVSIHMLWEEVEHAV